MILKYTITDNKLIKDNPMDYPVHLQENIILQFNDKHNLINDKSYVLIKTYDKIEKVKIIKNEGLYVCKLPKGVTTNTFFKIKVIIDVDNQKMITNELIVPLRVDDYLDYNRGIKHSFRKAQLKNNVVYDEHMNRYDEKWKYPIIPTRVRNV